MVIQAGKKLRTPLEMNPFLQFSRKKTHGRVARQRQWCSVLPRRPLSSLFFNYSEEAQLNKKIASIVLRLREQQTEAP